MILKKKIQTKNKIRSIVKYEDYCNTKSKQRENPNQKKNRFDKFGLHLSVAAQV